MKFPIIKVRDKGSNDKGYCLGVDEAHHQLILDNNSNLKFFNAQCCDGTGNDGTFEFVTRNGCYGKDIEFGDIFDLININKDYLHIKDDQLLKKYEIAVDQLKNVFSEAENARDEYLESLVENYFK